MHSLNWLLALFFLNNSLITSCYDKLNKKLEKKWEALRQPLLRKKALVLSQKQMLNVLGLDEIPNRNRRVQRPHKFMLDLYNKLSRGTKRWKAKRPARGIINTVRGIVDQEIHDRSLSMQYHQLYMFDLSSAIPQKDDIVAAELRILRRPVLNSEKLISEYGTTFKVIIYSKRRISLFPSQTPYKYPGLESLDSFTFDITDSEENWNVFTVSKAVQNQHQLFNKQIYLQLAVQSLLNGKFVSPTLLGFGKEKRSYRNRALLVVFSNDDKEETQSKTFTNKEPLSEHWMEVAHSSDVHARVKRGARRRRKKHQCRVKSLPVDFTQLDWNSWVIAPRGYDAGICDGMCRFPLEVHQRASNHATVQTILNTVDPSAVPPVCCVPNKLSSLGILYTDPAGVIVYKTYKNMIVERCGCS